MQGPNLDTVAARRAQIASELAGLDKLRAEMVAEDQDLVVAERALKRLAAASPSSESKASNVHRLAE